MPFQNCGGVTFVTLEKRVIVVCVYGLFYVVTGDVICQLPHHNFPTVI